MTTKFPALHMINPTEQDIGRKVIYRERGDHRRKKIEEGTLTSFNAHSAFVRYRGCTSAATNYEDLEWSSRQPEDTAISVTMRGGKVLEINFIPPPISMTETKGGR